MTKSNSDGKSEQRSQKSLSLDSTNALAEISHLELTREVFRRARLEDLEKRAQLLKLIADALSLSPVEASSLRLDSPQNERSLNLLKLAHDADERDEVSRAITLYQQHLSLNERDEWARLKLGRLLIDQGERERATQVHQESPYYPLISESSDTLSAEHAPTLILGAELHLTQIDYRRAHKLVTRAHQLDPEHVEVKLAYAHCCGWVGEERLEAEALRDAAMSEPAHAPALARFWSCEYWQHPPLEALDALIQLSHSSRDRVVQHALVTGLLRAQKLSEAHDLGASLVARVPESQSARLLLASTLFHLARAREALALCEELFKEEMLAPPLSALYLASLISLNDQGDQEHLDLLRVWGERSPRVAIWYAQFLEMFGHDDEAHWLRERLVEHYSDARSAALDHMQSLLRRGEDERCYSLVSQLLEREPNHLEGWLLMAQVNLQRGDLDHAEESLAECNDSPSAREVKLRLLIARGAYDQAVELALELCHQNPAQSTLIEYLLNALWQRFESEERLTDDLLKIYHGLPESTRPPTLLTLFAYLFFHLGQHQLAAQLVEEVYKSGKLIGFRIQRLRFACELARYLRFDVALEAWSSAALELYPNDSDLILLRGVSLWRRGEHEDAFQLGLKSLSASPEDELNLDHLVEVTIWACELKHYELAEGLVEQIADDPDASIAELRALSLRIWINLLNPPDFKRAVDSAREWLLEAEEPERVELLLDWCIETGIAGVAQPVDDHKGSEERLDEAPNEALFDEREDPEQAEIPLDRVELLEMISAQACEWAFEGIQRFPDSIEIRRRLSFLLNIRGQLEAAIYSQERVLESPLAIASDWLSVAHLYESAGSINQARIAFSEACDHAEDLSEIERDQYALERACFSLRNQEPEVAREIFEEVIERAELFEELPGERDLDNTTGEGALTAADTGHLRDVLFIWLSQSFEHLSYERFFELAEELHDQHPGGVTSGFFGIGYLYLDDPVSALSLLDRAREVDDYFSLEYAHCLWALDERDEALSMLSELVVRRPKEVECRHLFLQMLIEEGDVTAAHQQLLELTELAPGLEDLSEMRAHINALMTIH